ncbi:hypothetical protein Taro_006476 [Colocasia esculenta]|uniref:Uncharacterized protein n=1 Tax=Colocasia esculenta TaxID=4460 RepID=A0A843TX21_COLES|nr:hypothetical protein [Colocasia esculenta]
MFEHQSISYFNCSGVKVNTSTFQESELPLQLSKSRMLEQPEELFIEGCWVMICIRIDLMSECLNVFDNDIIDVEKT